MRPVDKDHYAGVLVVARLGYEVECARELGAIPGITVETRAPNDGRLIIVIEAPTRAHLESLHERVARTPHVLAADPIVHYVDSVSAEATPPD